MTIVYLLRSMPISYIIESQSRLILYAFNTFFGVRTMVIFTANRKY